MKQLVCLGMLVAVGFLWNGCRKDDFAPVAVRAGASSTADTLGKRGLIFSGDESSNPRNAAPGPQAPGREANAAIKGGIMKGETGGNDAR